MKKISLLASSLLLSSSFAFASESLENAFKNGTTTGLLEVYSVTNDKKVGENEGFTTGAVGLTYETASLNGFSAKAGFLGVHVFDELHNGDSDGDIESKALLNLANIAYKDASYSLRVGRQAVNLEWMSDYHEAVMGTINTIPNTSILLGYSDKYAAADADEISESFEKINDKKGIYVADIIYNGITDLELNPYYYDAPELGSLYGIKATYFLDDAELGAQYAKSNEDKNSTFEDGSILNLTASTSLSGVDFGAGYVKTDENGTGSIVDLDIGDNISPFEDGNHVYDEDAKTVYGNVGYSFGDIGFGLLYGQTKYGSDKEKELNLSSEIEIIDDVLELELLYVNVNTDDSNGDYQKFIAEIEYNF